MADTPETTKPNLTPANENPWYCLMTLHDEQPEGADWFNYDHQLHAKNRLDWNRWAARALTDDKRKALLEAKDRFGNPRFSLEELTPHSEAEWAVLAAKFASRMQRGRARALPEPADSIDCSNILFERPVILSGYLFAGNADLSDATFSGDANLSGAMFSGNAFLTDVTFSRDADLEGATFSGYAFLVDATFSGYARLSGATFSGEANLQGVTFSGKADLSDARFSGYADLSGTTFSGYADLSGAMFSGVADLSGAMFSGVADLKGTTFSGFANLLGATFSGFADFSGAKFSRKHEATFEKVTFGYVTSFLNAELEGKTSFARAIFKTHPPSFHGAKLNEGTAFDGVTWPDPPSLPARPISTGDDEKDGRAMEAWEHARNTLEDDIKNYQRLKQMMETLKKHEDELEFFAREMACKQVLHRANGETGKAWLLEMYGTLSDYGRSIARPIVGLAWTMGATTFIFWIWMSWDTPNAHTLPKFKNALGLSFGNLLAPLNFRKDFFDPEFIAELPQSIKLISGFQTLAGVFFTFLIGLGLRNRFRMK